MYYPMRVVRTRTYKLILNLAHPLEFPFASDLWDSDMWQEVRKLGDKSMGRRSVDAYLHRPKVELYDVANDPCELKNLAEDTRLVEVRKELEAKLVAWRKATNDPWLIKDKHE